MTIWIPGKDRIEELVKNIANEIKKADEINDIEQWLDDSLCSIQSHIANRASVERGEIHE